MTAYSFQRIFCEPIVNGTKGGTIRAPRLRGHAKPGGQLQLYFGMRTKQCRLIARQVCLETERISLLLASDRVAFAGDASTPFRLMLWRPADLNRFAAFDGFASWDELKSFWWNQPSFFGVHVRWLPLPEFTHA